MKRNLIPKEHDPLVGRDAWADPLFALQRGINRMFEDMWRGFDVPTVFGGHRFPSIEVKDKDKELVVTAELPGLTDKDVELTLRDGVLTLKGEKKSETDHETEAGSVSERWYGSFERRLGVGDVDEDKVAASYDNGVLTITLPKVAKAKETGRTIPIAAK